MLDEAFLESVFERQRLMLRNTEVEHPRYLVMMAGPPGSGKSLLAQKIDEQFGAVRIVSDDIRAIIDGLRPGLSLAHREDILNAYRKWLLPRLTTFRNGLVTLDHSIDRLYGSYFDFATEYSYQTMVVSFEIDRATLEEDIKKSKSTPETYLPNMERYLADHRDFRSRVIPDFEIHNFKEADEAVEKIGEQLKQKGVTS